MPNEPEGGSRSTLQWCGNVKSEFQCSGMAELHGNMIWNSVPKCCSWSCNGCPNPFNSCAIVRTRGPWDNFWGVTTSTCTFHLFLFPSLFQSFECVSWLMGPSKVYSPAATPAQPLSLSIPPERCRLSALTQACWSLCGREPALCSFPQVQRTRSRVIRKHIRVWILDSEKTSS